MRPTVQDSTSALGWISIFAGTLWKSVEIVHNLEYLRSVSVEHLDIHAIVRFVLELPPLLLIGGGCIWLCALRFRRTRIGQAPELRDDRSASPASEPGTSRSVSVTVRRRLLEEVEIVYRDDSV